MNRAGILDFAVSLRLGPPSRDYRANWVNFSCPFAPWKHAGGTDKSRDFGITVDDGQRSAYFCLACKERGTFAQLAYDLGRRRGEDYINIGHEIERAELVGPRLVLPKWDDPLPEFTSDEAPKPPAWPQAYEEFRYTSAVGHPYLRERKIGWNTTLGIGLRFDPFQRRVLFPVYSITGRFAGFSGRRIDPPFTYTDTGEPIERDGRKFIKVRDYCGLRKSDHFLSRSHTNTRKGRHIILCEGLFDYAWFEELVCDGTTFAILGTWLGGSKTRLLSELGRPVVIFTDNDVAGLQARDQIVKDLHGQIPLLDVCYPEGFEGADPHSLPPEVVHKMLKEANLILDKNPRYTVI